jgi:holo-[acyl-carrier protein] synthase
MILGHGVDICDVHRIQQAIEKAETSMLVKIFTEREINYCEAKKTKYQSYSARFAVKEAFIKALGTGWSDGITWTDIETINDANGKPSVVLYEKAKEKFEAFGYTNIFVSISHTKDNVVASLIFT